MTQTDSTDKLSMSLDDIIAGNRGNPKRKTSITKKDGVNKSLNRRNRFGNSGMKDYGKNYMNLYSVIVTGISKQIDKNLLKAHFSRCGRVYGVEISSNDTTIVTFFDEGCSNRAVKELDGTRIKGDIITVRVGSVVRKAIFAGRDRMDIRADYSSQFDDSNRISRNFIDGYENIYHNSDSFDTPNYTNFGQRYSVNNNLINNHVGNGIYHSQKNFDGDQRRGFDVALSPYARNYENNSHTIIITNVPKDLCAQEIQEAFRCVGKILRTDLLLTGNGKHTGRAAVVYATLNSAEEAVRRFDGGELNNNKIRVFLE